MCWIGKSTDLSANVKRGSGRLHLYGPFKTINWPHSVNNGYIFFRYSLAEYMIYWVFDILTVKILYMFQIFTQNVLSGEIRYNIYLSILCSIIQYNVLIFLFLLLVGAAIMKRCSASTSCGRTFLCSLLKRFIPHLFFRTDTKWGIFLHCASVVRLLAGSHFLIYS